MGDVWKVVRHHDLCPEGRRLPSALCGRLPQNWESYARSNHTRVSGAIHGCDTDQVEQRNLLNVFGRKNYRRQLSNIANDIVTANSGKIPKSMKGGTGALENRITATDGYKQILKNWLTSRGDSKAKLWHSTSCR